MPFWRMIQRILTCADRIYMTRESFGAPYVIYKINNQLYRGEVVNNTIGYITNYEPSQEDMFANDWEEFKLVAE